MKPTYILLTIALLSILSCRKDSSKFVVVTNSNKCLVQKLESLDSDGEASTMVFKYAEDSLISSIVFSDDNFKVAYNLKKEATGQYLQTGEGSSSNVESIPSRIYLNADGTIAKEALVHKDGTGKYVDDPDSVDTYTYNSKKQLLKVIVKTGYGPEVIDLTYDTKGRVQKIISKDELGTLQYTYDNFSYLEQKKTDNYVVLPFYFASIPSSYFIPVLRNAHISGYRLSYPASAGSPAEIETESRQYTFSNGNMSRMVTTVTAGTDSYSVTDKVTLSCK